MSDEPIRMLLLVAHPDDAEAHAGGLMTIYRAFGHSVKWVSLTNGDAGHHRISGAELAAIRRQEAEAAAAVIGAECEVWDNHDGQLMPTLALRHDVIREIRRYQPDLVLTHRTCDYHPDHRAVGQVVQDASYLVTVPPIASDVPALRRDPVVAYMGDRFTRPAKLRGDIVLDITGQRAAIVEMLHCHASQMYQWLPYNWSVESEVPESETARKAWLADFFTRRHAGRVAHEYRQELRQAYGEEQGMGAELAEVYEVSEYAAPLDEAARQRLFGFVHQATQTR